MKKTIKKQHAITEHYLVPLVLIALNVCTIHLIYTYSWGGPQGTIQFIALLLAAMCLIGSLIFRRPYLLVFAMVYYAVVFIIFDVLSI